MSLTADQIRASLEAKKKLLPAPALAEPIADNRESSRRETPAHDGEARESAESQLPDSPGLANSNQDSRGRQKSSPAKSSTRNIASNVPQAPEIETAVLSSLYQYPATCFPIFNERARAEFFFSPINRSFFSLLSDYFTEHGQADPQSFLQSLLDSAQLERHGGTAFLSSLLTAASPPSALEYHLDILRDKYVAREAARLSNALAEKVGKAGETELWSLITDHEAAISNLRALATETMEGVENFAYTDLLSFESNKDPTTLIGNRWLCRGFTCLWAAPAGIGKSSLEMQLAIYWAGGQPCFGIKPVRPLKSLIVQAENDIGDTGEQLQGVLAGIKATGDLSMNGEVERMIIVVRLTGCVGTVFLSTLGSLLKLHKPDMVWIDPLFAFAGCNLLDAKEVGLFLREGLIPLTLAHGVCAHVIHHASKTSQDSKSKSHWSEIDYQYLGFGTSEIQNSFRAVNIIVPVPSQDNLFRLILSKRGARAGALDLNHDPATSLYLSHSKEGICWLQSDSPQKKERAGGRKDFHLEDLLSEMSVTEPLKTSALCKHACTETGMSRATFYRFFDEAKKQQKIRLNNDGWILI